MSDNFEQISTKSGFMKHNGGLLVKKISENEFHFKTKVTANHLNRAGITHGGYIASIIDAGCGSAAHRSVENIPCVTIADWNIAYISNGPPEDTWNAIKTRA